MKGADEFKSLFPAHARYDRGMLSVFAGEHARGYTLTIRANGVEVFGVVDGNPGWTETYGWLFDGPWKKDFEDFCSERQSALYENEKANAALLESRLAREKEQREKLLAEYESHTPAKAGQP